MWIYHIYRYTWYLCEHGRVFFFKYVCISGVQSAINAPAFARSTECCPRAYSYTKVWGRDAPATGLGSSMWLADCDEWGVIGRCVSVRCKVRKCVSVQSRAEMTFEINDSQDRVKDNCDGWSTCSMSFSIRILSVFCTWWVSAGKTALPDEQCRQLNHVCICVHGGFDSFAIV